MTTAFSCAQAQSHESTACFSLTAVSDPGTLPRVLGVFAKLGHVPYQCHATAFGADNADLHIDLQFQAMTQAEGEHLARTLRGCVLVRSVLTSQKQARLIA